MYDIIEVLMKLKNDHLEITKEEYESNFDDYRDIDEEEMENCINKKLGELPIHKFLQQLGLIDLLWSYDANSLYPSAMSDEQSIYRRKDTGYAPTPDMNDDIVKKFNEGNFTQGGAILKIKYYNPKYLIVQFLPCKERVNTTEINRMRNSYIVDTLNSVDIQKIFKIGVKIIGAYEGVSHRENCKVSPLKKVIIAIFELRQKYKEEKNDVMEVLVKLIMNSLYGEQIRKDIEESYECKPEDWKMTEYDERVLDYQKINHGIYLYCEIER